MSNSIYIQDGKIQPNPDIPVSFFRHVEENDGINSLMPWTQFGALLESYSGQPIQSKEDAPLFSPTVFDGLRGLRGATGSGMLVVDVDGGLQIGDVVRILEQDCIESIVYTSASNRTGDHFRIVIPLWEIVDAPTQKKAVRAFCDYLRERLEIPEWKPDTGKSNPYSLFYVPARYDGASNLFHHIMGDCIGAEDWIGAWPQSEEREPKTGERVEFTLDRRREWNPYEKECWQQYMSLTGERYNALYGLMSRLAMSAINALYDVNEHEIAELAYEAQSANPPSQAKHRRSFPELLIEARTALADARDRVTEPTAIKWLNMQRFGQPEPWKSGTKGVASLADMIEEVSNDPREERSVPMEDKGLSPPDRAKKRFFSSPECAAVPPPTWEIWNLIPENADVAIYGKSGTLKSFVALDIAMSLATALKAFGYLDVTQQKPCFYFAGEGFHNVIKKRQLAWQLHRGLMPFSLDNLWFVNGTPTINEPKLVDADVAEMQRLLDGRPLGVFVIDTLSRALNGGDEDKAHTASQYFAMLKKIRDACGGGVSITVGHFGKDEDRGERGSSNFRASYDTIIWIEKHEKDEETGIHTIQLFVTKQKDADDGRRIWLQSLSVPLATDDESPTSLVLVPLSEDEGRTILQTKRQKDTEQRQSSLEEMIREAIEFLVPGGGHISNEKLVNYLAEREKGPNTSNDELRKTKNRWQARLKRGREAGQVLRKFAYRESDWCMPLREVAAGQAAETINEINELFKRRILADTTC